jgi:hypothetical protein
VFGGELLVSAGEGEALRGLHGLFGAVGVEVEIQGGHPLLRRIPEDPSFEASKAPSGCG